MIEIDDDMLNRSLNEVAATDAGKIVLASLKDYCRFDGDILAENNTENTYANALLRRAYLNLRNRIRTEHLKKIEFDYKRKVAHGNTTDTRKPTRTAKPTK